MGSIFRAYRKYCVQLFNHQTVIPGCDSKQRSASNKFGIHIYINMECKIISRMTGFILGFEKMALEQIYLELPGHQIIDSEVKDRCAILICRRNCNAHT